MLNKCVIGYNGHGKSLRRRYLHFSGETEAQEDKKLAKATQQRSWDSNPGLAG